MQPAIVPGARRTQAVILVYRPFTKSPDRNRHEESNPVSVAATPDPGIR